MIFPISYKSQLWATAALLDKILAKLDVVLRPDVLFDVGNILKNPFSPDQKHTLCYMF